MFSITPYVALNDLDKKLECYFPTLRNGFFVETGAHNGMDQSNTYYFEGAKDWTGILIEPIPSLAVQCKRNRPCCITVNTALSSYEYCSTHTTIEMTACGLMSLVEGAMGSAEKDQAHIAAGEQCQNIKANKITVPVATLDNVLDLYKVQNKQIDLFSLDVEGYELEVLKGFSIEKYEPQYVLIETRNKDLLDEYMISKKYKFITLLSYHDALYIPNKD
jgi:FkbM family methyltransferase